MSSSIQQIFLKEEPEVTVHSDMSRIYWLPSLVAKKYRGYIIDTSLIALHWSIFETKNNL